MNYSNFKIESKVLSSIEIYIVVTGIIDTISSETFGKYVYECHNKYPKSKITIDFTKVEMITSACMRYLLKFKKDEINYELVGVKREVYTVLKLSGMSEVLNIEQETISVDTTGCKLLGKGFHSEVYKLNDETIAKVYYDLPDIDMLITERIIAKQAFVKGVPTEISFGLCESDGKAGLVYELVDAETLLSIFSKDDSSIEKYVKDYVEIVKKINTFDSEGIIEIPKAKDILGNDVNYLKDYLNINEYQTLSNILNSVEDSNHLLHGDPHPANVMLTNKGMVFIDLSDMRTGNKLFDLVYLNRTLIQFQKFPDNYALNKEQCNKLWTLFVNEYYKDESNVERELAIIDVLSITSITVKFLMKDVTSENGYTLLEELKNKLNNWLY